MSLTNDGQDFLKMATASPDFEDLEVSGIPDSYTGKSIVVRENLTSTVICPAGRATFIIVTPTAGTSYYTGDAPLGVDLPSGQVFTAVMHTDAATLYPFSVDEQKDVFAGDNTNNVNQGRMISCSAELNVMNNAFNRYGSIACFKTNLGTALTTRDTVGADITAGSQYTDNRTVTGARALVPFVLGSDAYVKPVRDGAYSVSMNREGTFPWAPVLDGESQVSVHDAIVGPGNLTGSPKILFKGPLVCWDNEYDSIVFRVDVPPSPALPQSFIFQVWKTWEFLPVFNSLLYNMAFASPMEDKNSLALYSSLKRNLPVAVPSKDNPDFWDTILGAVKSTSGLAQHLPGPVGGVAKGVHAITQALTPGRRSARRPKTSKRPPAPKKRRKKKRKGKKKR